nr:hypothetical protein [Verminephrobacter aporrectodeae]
MVSALVTARLSVSVTVLPDTATLFTLMAAALPALLTAKAEAAAVLAASRLPSSV